MIQPLLSILIPTVVGREESYNKLFQLISKQCMSLDNYDKSKSYGFVSAIRDAMAGVCWGGLVEVITEKDNKEMTIGEKREILYKSASGLYSWQIDDDDDISYNAIELILNAIKSNPDVDCVSFKELVNIDGVISNSNFSLRYGDWEGNGSSVLEDGFTYHRTPFFKTPIKTSICQSVGVKPIRFAEDHDFAQRIKPLLKTEYYIDEYIYHYIHNSSNPTERYGLDK